MQKTALPKTALTAKAIAITAEIEMTLNCIRSILAVEGHFCSLLISNIIWLSSLSFICLSLRNCFPFHLYNSRQVRSTFVSLRKLVSFPLFSHFSLPLCQNHIKTFLSNKNRRSCSASAFFNGNLGVFEGLLVHWFVPSFL